MDINAQETSRIATSDWVQRRYGKIQMVAEKIAMAAMQSILFPTSLRPPLLRMFGAKIGHNVWIKQKVFVGRPGNLRIDDDAVINIGSFIDCSATVHIGNKVRIGYETMIVTGSHKARNSVYRRQQGDHYCHPVVIERGCWIQSRTMIGPGVVMAEGCTLLAYGVLLKSTMPNGEYAGIPAIRKRDLSTIDDQKSARNY